MKIKRKKWNGENFIEIVEYFGYSQQIMSNPFEASELIVIKSNVDVINVKIGDWIYKKGKEFFVCKGKKKSSKDDIHTYTLKEY